MTQFGREASWMAKLKSLQMSLTRPQRNSDAVHDEKGTTTPGARKKKNPPLWREVLGKEKSLKASCLPKLCPPQRRPPYSGLLAPPKLQEASARLLYNLPTSRGVGEVEAAVPASYGAKPKLGSPKRRTRGRGK